MEYRFLGNSGLKVSCISLGNWVHSANTEDGQKTFNAIVKTAWDAGVNFFDSAEIYGFGVAETQLGIALKELNVPREQIVISSKVWQHGGSHNAEEKINMIGTSHKRVTEQVRNMCKRL